MMWTNFHYYMAYARCIKMLLEVAYCGRENLWSLFKNLES